MPELNKRPVVLVVRDGWGHNPDDSQNACNAVRLGQTPVDDRLLRDYPNVRIRTSGEDVGLPAGVMGNSEVGHQNIGAGRIVDQELMRITRAIRDGAFFENQTLLAALAHIEKSGGVLHLLGLVSDGGVHSHIEHLFALLELCQRRKAPADRVMVHVITDGRDTSPKSGIEFVARLQDKIKQTGVGRIASVIGRYWAMDRDFRWDRVQKCYDLLTRAAAPTAASAREAIAAYYENPTEPNRSGDEFITPVCIAPSGEVDPAQRISAGDAVVFFNFRGDRPRELTKAFILPDDQWSAIQGGGFDRGQRIEPLYFATMARYEESLTVPVVFEKPPKMVNTLGEVLSNQGLAQFRCAESEKHPHVTYFFNDYRQPCWPRELQLDIPSPKHVATYDQLPEMSAHAVTHAVVNAINSDIFDFILVNYANGDMVGHTGSLQAAIAAVETVDDCVGKLVAAVQGRGGALVITADHGNCEQMIDPETGGPHTKHTTYDVDLIVVDDAFRGAHLRTGGRLADIAPTVLQLLGLPKPDEMTGVSLLEG